MPVYSFICEVCGHAGQAWRSEEQGPPRFCSRACQKKSGHPISRKGRTKVRRITSEIHNRIFEVYNHGIGQGRVKALALELGISAARISKYAHSQGWSTRHNKKSERKKARKKRAFAALHCKKYRECRDAAAYANQPMNCHKCDMLDFEANHYQKEIGIENLNHHYTGEHQIKIEGGEHDRL